MEGGNVSEKGNEIHSKENFLNVSGVGGREGARK